MKYIGDCPICQGKVEWVKNLNIPGVVSLGTLSRNVKSRENPGNWIIEVVTINRDETVVHSTRYDGVTCYVWGEDDIVWEPGDAYFPSEPYEIDEGA